MGLDIYSGITVTAGQSEITTPFNKLAITEESLLKRVGFFGAQIQTTYILPARTFSQGADFNLPFDTLNYDTSAFWGSAAPDRLIIPPGFNYAEVWLAVGFPVGNWSARLFQNGSLLNTGTYGSANNEYQNQNIKTWKVACVAGDYFQGSILVAGAGTSTWDQKYADGYGGSLVTIQPTPTYGIMTIRGYQLP